jgi:hypothetical protein
MNLKTMSVPREIGSVSTLCYMLGPKVCRLAAGAKGIRTAGPTYDGDAFQNTLFRRPELHTRLKADPLRPEGDRRFESPFAPGRVTSKKLRRRLHRIWGRGSPHGRSGVADERFSDTGSDTESVRSRGNQVTLANLTDFSTRRRLTRVTTSQPQP